MKLPGELNPAITAPTLRGALDRLCGSARLPEADPEVGYLERIEKALSDDPAGYLKWLNRVAAERLRSEEAQAEIATTQRALIALMRTAALSAYACAEAMQICLSDMILLEDLANSDVPRPSIASLRTDLLWQSLDLVARLVKNISVRAKVHHGHGADGAAKGIRLAELDALRPASVYQESRGPVLAVLSAGRGTRLRSTIPKGLIPVAGVPMIARVVQAAMGAGVEHVIFILKYRPECQLHYLSRWGPVIVQDKAEGTAHSAFFALSALHEKSWPVVMSFSDQPFLVPDSFGRLLDATRTVAGDMVMAIFSPAGSETGRVIRDSMGAVERVAQPRLVNADSLEGDGGLYAMRYGPVLRALGNLRNDNLRREFNLPDVVEELSRTGGRVATVTAPAAEFQSVNTPRDLVLAQLRAAAGSSQNASEAARFFAARGATGPSDDAVVTSSMDRVESLVGPILDLGQEGP